MSTASLLPIAVKVRFVCVVVVCRTVYVFGLISCSGIYFDLCLVTSMCVLSVEACVSTVETQFGSTVCMGPRKGCTCAHLAWLLVTVLIHRVRSLVIGFVSPGLPESRVKISIGGTFRIDQVKRVSSI